MLNMIVMIASALITREDFIGHCQQRRSIRAYFPSQKSWERHPRIETEPRERDLQLERFVRERNVRRAGKYRRHTDAITLKHRYHRHGKIENRKPAVIEGQHEIPKLLLAAPGPSQADQHVAMTADREVLSGSPNDHCLYRGVFLYESEMSAEGISHLGAHYVGSLRIVQGQDCDCALIERFQMDSRPGTGNRQFF
jgi:hypothetical protein